MSFITLNRVKISLKEEIKTDRSRRVGLNGLHAVESRTTVLEVKERDSSVQGDWKD